MLRNPVSLVLLLLPALACTSSDPAKPAPAAVAPVPAVEPAAKAPAPTAAAAPAATPAPAATTAAQSGELRFDAQPGWIAETPTSSMRKAQFRLPGAEGSGDASLVVYYFGAGGGGGVEANLERWAGQFEQPDGSDSKAAMKSSKRVVNGVNVTDVALGGTYVAETSPGSGERVNEEGWRMLASILEAKSGAHYVKLVGPAATVARWEASYKSFVDAAP
jgi:hypothetical protein